MSRDKGNKGEREVAALVQAWWCVAEPEEKFIRTPLSGGWGGPTLRGVFQAAGDLMTTSKTFPLAIEVKRRERWDWERVLSNRPSPVWVWWGQAQEQALEMGKVPSLWIRKNREKTWHVMLPIRDAERWGIPLKHVWDAELINVGIPPALVTHHDIFAIHPLVFVDGTKESRRAKRAGSR